MSGLRPAFRPSGSLGFWIFSAAILLGSLAQSGALSLPEFDFTTSAGARGWSPAHDISKLAPTPDGVVITISGVDPYLIGPPRNYPIAQPLWLRMRLKSDQSGSAQLFYFQTGATEANSVRFYVSGGDWVDVRVPMPPLTTGTRLRFDPPGTGGTCTLARIGFELRPQIREPAWLKPPLVIIPAGAPAVTSGELSLAYDGSALGAFALRVAGRTVAIGNSRSMIGYVSGNSPQWLALTNPVTVQPVANGIHVTALCNDPNGAEWRFEQIFQKSGRPGGIEVESRVTVSQDRSILFLPMLLVLPGVGSFGTNKTQALLAGVEYLENEPSSSQADIVGPAAQRRVPDSLKLTAPLMALSANSCYLGLIWEQQRHFAALHDSPDRTFQSGGHVMGLIFPGADPAVRQDGSLLPYAGERLRAGQPLVLHATILGGRGTTVVPAVQEFLARRGLPALPDTGYSAADYFALTAHGWLDSKIRDGSKFRHAVGGSFGSVPATDAAYEMDWLSARIQDSNLSSRLSDAAREARALVAPPNYNSAAVGHVRFPVAALVYGSVPENATVALNEGLAQLSLFQPDGSMLYTPPAKGPDLSRTHGSREANGLAAAHVAAALERAAFSGDRGLTDKALQLLRALEKFRDTVPRGAQTWEVPLHTPDILASAWLVRAYTLGFELTGEEDFLAQARSWAWTGVPFVYLTPPTDKPVGVYSTIPVFGATQFVAPVWIGLPVQWCGLVYADAIRRFARLDPSGPWVQLANGIAAAGLQQTHPAAEPQSQGLLPDSFDLRAQVRNPVPINPATLFPEATQMFGVPPLYDFRSLRHHGLLIHAPGPITGIHERSAEIVFQVNGWPQSPWYVLINGFTARPALKLNGAEAAIQSPHQFQAAQGRLILRLHGPTKVEILYRAKDAVQIERQPNFSIELRWPLDATNYVLERAALPFFSATWQPVTESIKTRLSQRIFTTSADKQSEFFRLRER